MGKNTLRLAILELGKNKFHCNNTPIFLKDVDIKKLLVSNKISNTLLITCIMIIKLGRYM